MALEDAIKFAYKQEVLFVVAATDSADNLASFSNFDTRSVNIGAPGVNILSTYISAAGSPQNVFSYLSGTSMATPFVAGTAILQLYERPELYSFQLKNIILQKSDTVPALVGKVLTPVRLNSFSSVQVSKLAVATVDHPPNSALMMLVLLMLPLIAALKLRMNRPKSVFFVTYNK